MAWLRMKDVQLIILYSFTDPGFKLGCLIILCIQDNFMFGFKLVLGLWGKIAFFLLLKLISVFKILRGEDLQEAILFFFSTELPTGARKIVQWLGELLFQMPFLFPESTEWLTAIRSYYSLRRSNAFFWPPHGLGTQMVRKHTCRQSYSYA